MFELLKQDLNAQTNNGSLKHKMKCLLLNHSVHMLIFIRLGCWVDKTVPYVGGFLRYLIEYFIRIVFSSDISCRARIGGGLNIMHGHDIVIGSGVVIGKNCKIFNGVTMGNKETEAYQVAHPQLGNGVVIGTGAKILGQVCIGDNAKVGANSVVLKDIPPNSTWAGVPAREIKKAQKA
jgi:serine O-acetyltransferase